MTDDELARRYQAREDLAALAAAAGMSTGGVHARLRRMGVPAHMRPDRAHTLTAEQIAAALAAEGTVAGAARRVGAGWGAFRANAWRLGLLPLPDIPEDLGERYRAGATVAELAIHYDIGATTITRWLTAAGVASRTTWQRSRPSDTP